MPAVAAGDAPGSGEAAFASVNGHMISAERYEAELLIAARQKFYHRRPPEEQLSELRREVGDRLIDAELLVAEARRRGIAPDHKEVSKAVAEFEERNKANPRWQQKRDSMRAQLVRELEERSLLDQLEHRVRDVAGPDDKEARRYFQDHLDRFTEPERLRLSFILLKREPSAPESAWQEQQRQARLVWKRLEEGASFEALAKQYSGHPSAAQGGSLGYLHRGMLAEEAQREIDALKPGELSKPITMLEGVGIFRLEERQKTRSRTFEQSREQVAKLWKRARADQAWSGLKESLRQSADIRILDRSRYPIKAAAH